MFSNILSHVFKPKEERSLEDLDPSNGSKLKDIYLPDEVLELILCHVELQTLLKCRLVCKKWNTLISEHVMKTKASWAGFTQGMSPEDKLNIPWSTWYTFLNPGSLFACNLLRNPCGEEGLKYWKITRQGGDGWLVEKSPNGLVADEPLTPPDDLPLRNYHEKRKGNNEIKQSTSCFVSSYGPCEKEQTVNLAPFSIMENILDTWKPAIVYREWFCRRFDCGGHYTLRVQLLDKDMKVLKEKNHQRRVVEDCNWLRVENKFENYPAGVRFVTFKHLAVDNQFWKGHYGPKLTGAALYLLPPGVAHEIPVDNNVPEAGPLHGDFALHPNFMVMAWDGVVELQPLDSDEEVEEEEEEEEEDEEEEGEEGEEREEE